MEGPYNGESTNRNLQIIKYSPPNYKPRTKPSSHWFDLRVFYVRVCGFRVDESTPEFLTLYYVPLSPDTLLEVNGVRSSMYSDGVSSAVLRRNRVDKKSSEATFVNTDSIRLTGSMKFEVYDKDDCILSGALTMSNSNGFTGESKSNAKRWSMSYETDIKARSGFLKGEHAATPKSLCPAIEVYVAGCFSGTPIILTKTLQLNFRKKLSRKCTLDAIPEYETTESQKDASEGVDLQVVDYRSFKLENEDDYNSMYWQRTGYIDGEDGELSWFNAGVRVGVGIGLGVCLGIGIGVGLLVRSYRATTRNFKRRLI